MSSAHPGSVRRPQRLRLLKPSRVQSPRARREERRVTRFDEGRPPPVVGRRDRRSATQS
jgi:hypothetical protein